MKWLKLAYILAKYTVAQLWAAVRFRTSKVCRKLQKRGPNK